MSTPNSHPIAVLISDLHFSLQNLEPASEALLAALKYSYENELDLIIAGDLLDGKAIIRAEVMNRLIDIFSTHQADQYSSIYILVGNHDLVSEKAEEHSLRFLAPYACIVNGSFIIGDTDIIMISYQSNSDKFKALLAEVPENATIVCHQGVQTADMGHYQLDKSSLPKETFSDFRVISGHYHKRQDIKCGRPRKGGIGLFSYLGSPFTMNFGEAEQSSKGYSILYADGQLEFKPLTEIRRHVIFELEADNIMEKPKKLKPSDIIKVKVTGPMSKLHKIKKADIAKAWNLQDFSLELLPNDKELDTMLPKQKQSVVQILDALIDGSGETNEQKSFLKELWRKL